MQLEICEKCGKKMILSCASLAEVRRVAQGMPICRCDSPKIPEDIKQALIALDIVRKFNGPIV